MANDCPVNLCKQSEVQKEKGGKKPHLLPAQMIPFKFLQFWQRVTA